MIRPCLLLTMGDVAGIGPEVIARAWPELVKLCRPVVVGDPHWLRRGFELAGQATQVSVIDAVAQATPHAACAPCLRATAEKLDAVVPGQVSAAAGKAAYDFLCRAIDLTLARAADGIVTAPLHKEGLKAAGLNYPGHTEILAERTATRRFAMALYVKGPRTPHGLAVVHVTLHMALRKVFEHLSIVGVLEKIRLLNDLTRRLHGRPGRIAVAGLNPPASDGGLFGDEEATIIRPAVEQAQQEGIAAVGPLPSDTLFVRAQRGEFDGVVAMYHDQGHIALKLLGGMNAVNISVGLPIVRTSVAHGTAYDIAGQGKADPCSMIEAARVAAQLARG
jgi:4-hydroxythreonine-4-phosphate dehydrogenase